MTVLTLEGINVLDVAQTVPNTAILTAGLIEGDGVFDILMQTTKLHLLEEYDAGRITGKEYSSVYIGALSAVLQQAVAYIMNHQQAAKVTADVGLTRQKTVTELAQTDNDLPLGLGFNGGTTIEGLVAEQKLLNAQEILLATAKVTQSESENALIGQKIITELAQTDTDLTQAQVDNHGYNNTPVVEGLAKAQTAKVDSETDLTKQKVMTELAGTSDTLLNDYAKNTNTVLQGLLKSQLNKGVAEVQLLDQKSVTELAQTSDYIPADTGILTVPQGVIAGVDDEDGATGVTGRQRKLFTAQTNGFARDAEQKLAKIMVDPFIAVLAGDSNATVPSELTNPSLDQVLIIAKDGIGAAPVPPA